MGTLDFGDERDRQYLRSIRRRLLRRGLKPVLDEEWEVHGPHPGMPYMVFIGYAEDKKGYWHCVAIYPRAVYEIDDPKDWWKVEAEDRIPCWW